MENEVRDHGLKRNYSGDMWISVVKISVEVIFQDRICWVLTFEAYP
jgi:hypothetical protein